MSHSLLVRSAHVATGFGVCPNVVLGALTVDTTTNDAFLVEVPRRDAATLTLLPIIQRWVLPGSTVCTDEWAAYQLTAQTGLAHATVNHSVTFVALGTGVNTNAIENFWKCAKDNDHARVV